MMANMDVMALAVFSGSALTQVSVQLSTPLSLETAQVALLALQERSGIKALLIAQMIMTALIR